MPYFPDVPKSDRTEPDWTKPDLTPNRTESLIPIKSRYLLVALCIPLYVDASGRRYLHPLWVKDLIEHFKYLKNFMLASPCRYETPPDTFIPLDSFAEFKNVQFIDLPAPQTALTTVLSLPQTILKLWQAVGEADIVHGGVAGWLIPEGWLLTPMVWLRRKFYLIVVESAFWRLAPTSQRSLKYRLKAAITERVNRWCVNRADLTIFTQEYYRRSLLNHKSEQGFVINASWIDEQNVCTEVAVKERWQQAQGEAIARILFVGRLTPAKGVRVLLEAIPLAVQQGTSVQLDILGDGELLAECQAAAQKSAHIRLLGTRPYGPEFFALLQEYQAIVIPTLSDEQPRLIYDAYSQGVPVLASDTDGSRACVIEGITGRLVAPNDALALANLLQWAAENRDVLAQMGLDSLKKAHSLTHQEMHRQRWQILLQSLSKMKRLQALQSHEVGFD
jgi:glycosyltransferase involved in cell wall biosynthesis